MLDLVIDGKNIEKSYGNFKALDNLSINVERGKIYGLIGLNGAGKSTLLKLIMGLLSYDSGNLTVFGEKDSSKYLNRIGSIIEYPYFYEKLTGEENIKLHAAYLNYSDSNRIKEVIELVELSGAKDKKVCEYSLGMRQRLAIARAILNHPELLILDEPTNALDPEGIKSMRDLFKKINQENGTTILISSHILSEMELLADVIGILSDKKIIQEKPMQDIRNISRNHLKLIVDNSTKAIDLLEKSGVQNYEANGQEEIKIFDEIDVSGMVSNLVHNEVAIKEVYYKTCSLEEYFLDIAKRG